MSNPFRVCITFVLYLYCIVVGWVEKLQIALTPLGTPKAARWQLSAIKGSTILFVYDFLVERINNY